MRMVIARDSLEPMGSLILRCVCHYSWSRTLTLLRVALDLGQVLDSIVIGDSHPGGLAHVLSRTRGLGPRTVDEILDRTNLVHINVTDKIVSVQPPSGGSIMSSEITIDRGYPNGDP